MRTVELGIEANRSKKVYLSAHRIKSREFQAIIGKAKMKRVPVEILSAEDFRRKFPEAHQGIVSECRALPEKGLEEILKDRPQWLVALDHIEDPQNLGAIGRTCYALGVDSLLLPTRRQVGITAAVFQASAGYFHFLQIYRAANLRYACQFLKKHQYWIVAFSPKAPHSVEEYSRKLPCCVIFGAEHRGISPVVLQEADEWLHIPISEKVDSLNVSVSVGIGLYHLRKSAEESLSVYNINSGG